MPAHQRLRLEDNRGLAHGRAQPIEPDEDQAVCSAQPEPCWRGPLQDDKLLTEKCRFGLANRMRSEQSDEQSAEQLREVTHPQARIAHRGICASPDMIFGSHRRAGNSFILALIAAYLAIFRDWRPYLIPCEIGTIKVIAVDRRQARTIYRYWHALLADVPALAAYIARVDGETIELTNNVTIEIPP